MKVRVGGRELRLDLNRGPTVLDLATLNRDLGAFGMDGARDAEELMAAFREHKAVTDRAQAEGLPEPSTRFAFLFAGYFVFLALRQSGDRVSLFDAMERMDDSTVIEPEPADGLPKPGDRRPGKDPARKAGKKAAGRRRRTTSTPKSAPASSR